MGIRLWRHVAPALVVLGSVAALSGCGVDEGTTGSGDRHGLDRAPTSSVPDPHQMPGERAGTGPDGPPNHADNRRWRQRHELSPADRARAEDAAERIRGALAPLRRDDEYAPDAVAAAIGAAGFPHDSITTAPVRAPSDMGDLPGAAFGVQVGERGCVVGTVRPDRLTAEPKGSAAEFGCLEPFSH